MAVHGVDEAAGNRDGNRASIRMRHACTPAVVTAVDGQTGGRIIRAEDGPERTRIQGGLSRGGERDAALSPAAIYFFSLKKAESVEPSAKVAVAR